MIRCKNSITMFVTDITCSIAYYRIILSEEPQCSDERIASFAAGGQSNVILVKSDEPVRPQSAALLCDDLAERVREWDQWAGVVDLECRGTEWPIQFVVLRDPDDNMLVVLEAPLEQNHSSEITSCAIMPHRQSRSTGKWSELNM